MKRFEVITTYHSVWLCAVYGYKPTVQLTQYRWRWRARLECWFINTSPPFMGSIAAATWRPILRVVPENEVASA